MKIHKIAKIVVVLVLLIDNTVCKDITWTWLKGSNSANVMGTKTDPGGRSGAAYWVQQDKKAVWVFGGEHHIEHDQPGLENDLWKLDIPTTKWTLIHNGSAENSTLVPEPRQLASGCGIPGSFFLLYGGLNKNEEPLSDTWLFYIPEGKWYKLDDIRNKLDYSSDSDGQLEYPGVKGDAVSWCSNYTYDMFVFGGFVENDELSHDLWKFDLKQLLWKQMESSKKLPKDADFVKHLPYPRGRSGATKWATEKYLYMFGGNVENKNKRSKHLVIGNSADLWMYSIKLDNWTYIMGPKERCNHATVYGSVGMKSPEAYPGCRRQAAGWVDELNNLWLFGGDGIDNSRESLSVFTHSKLLADLWHFDTKEWLWTWKGGSEIGDEKGNYGKIGESDDKTTPGSRCESVAWYNGSVFHLFGGVGHDANGKDGYLNDVWELDVRFDSAILRNAPVPGQVFTVIIVGVGLVGILSFLFIVLRGSFQEQNDENRRGKYKRIDVTETEQ